MARGDVTVLTLALPLAGVAAAGPGRLRGRLGLRCRHGELLDSAEVDGAVRVLGAHVPAELAGLQASPHHVDEGPRLDVRPLTDGPPRQDLDGDGVRPQGLRPGLHPQLGVGHRELLVLGSQAGVVGVVVLQGGRVGARHHSLTLVVEVQQPQVAQTPFRQPLVVEEDLGDLAVVHAVAVVVEAVHAREGVVVVAGEHHRHVRIGRHHLVLDALRDRTEPAGGEHVLVEVDDRGAFWVLGQHLVHPGDLLVAGAPALVEHEEVHAVHGDQVVVAAVVLVGAPVPRVLLEPVGAEVRAEGPVVLPGVADVVVAGQHAVGQSGVVEHPVGGVRPLPLLRLVPFIHDVPGVEHVGEIETVAGLQEVVVDGPLVLVPGLVVVLRVRLPPQGEVELGPGQVRRMDRRRHGVAGAAVRVGEALGVLDEQAHLAVPDVVRHRDEAVQRELGGVAARGEGAVHLLPGARDGVERREDHLRLGVGAAVPGDPHLSVRGGVLHGHLEHLVGEGVLGADHVLPAVVLRHEREGLRIDGGGVTLHRVGHRRLARTHLQAGLAGDQPAALEEADVQPVPARVRHRGREGDVRPRHHGALGRRGYGRARTLHWGREDDRARADVAGQVAGSEHEPVLARGQVQGADLVGQVDGDAVQLRGQHVQAGAGV